MFLLVLSVLLGVSCVMWVANVIDVIVVVVSDAIGVFYWCCWCGWWYCECYWNYCCVDDTVVVWYYLMMFATDIMVICTMVLILLILLLYVRLLLKFGHHWCNAITIDIIQFIDASDMIGLYVGHVIDTISDVSLLFYCWYWCYDIIASCIDVSNKFLFFDMVGCIIIDVIDVGDIIDIVVNALILL